MRHSSGDAEDVRDVAGEREKTLKCDLGKVDLSPMAMLIDREIEAMLKLLSKSLKYWVKTSGLASTRRDPPSDFGRTGSKNDVGNQWAKLVSPS